MTALEVLRELIDGHGLRDAELTLVPHATGAGWREHVGPRPPPPAGVPVQGRLLRDISPDQLAEYRAAGDEVVSVSSRLILRGQERHLALMDLQVNDQVPFPLPFLRDVVEEHCGGRHAWILRTGRGYHVYGNFLLDERDWPHWNDRFLTRYALAHPLYVMQSLSWRCNLLRLTAAGDQQRIVPITVEDEPAGPMITAARRLAHARHAFQMSDGGEPVVKHLAEVALVAMRIHSHCRTLSDAVLAGCTPEELYACGYLHACLEDTATKYEDVQEAASPRVAEWVAELTRDKRVPSADGRESYEQQLVQASPPARIVKLADLLSELRGLTRGGGEGWTPDRLQSIDGQLGCIGAGLEGCGELDEARRLVGEGRELLVRRGARQYPATGRR